MASLICTITRPPSLPPYQRGSLRPPPGIAHYTIRNIDAVGGVERKCLPHSPPVANGKPWRLQPQPISHPRNTTVTTNSTKPSIDAIAEDPVIHSKFETGLISRFPMATSAPHLYIAHHNPLASTVISTINREAPRLCVNYQTSHQKMARTSPGGSNHHPQITLPAHTTIIKKNTVMKTPNLLHSSIPSPLRGFDKQFRREEAYLRALDFG
ncbi:hypothetical protein CSIM01_03803 [Colletotrichum simmondsii]|uniref:Uncharacterized protein n=1 Tax=Colletotrichum simmondsii TaxID=703756 RepID=A0A135TN12_9PEZI|nr:hypothetical protein CSIM01_03803 [Colletotrichum simmondsii]